MWFFLANFLNTFSNPCVTNRDKISYKCVSSNVLYDSQETPFEFPFCLFAKLVAVAQFFDLFVKGKRYPTYKQRKSER